MSVEAAPPDPSPAPAASAPDPSPAPETVIDLLAVLAYGELVAFDQMAADARLAPDLHRRAVLCEMAAGEIANYRRLADRIVALGGEPEAVMAPFIEPLAAYHETTEPRDWLEALAKAYIGESIADDFYREVAAFLAPGDRELVLEVLHDDRYAEFAAAEIKAAIEADPKVANRLALWARRLVGEALSQAQRVAAERASLTDLIVSGSGDLTAVAAMLKRLTTAHGARMSAVGLSN